MTVKRFRVFNFSDVDKFGVSDDVAEVTVAFCDKKWEADYLSDLLNDLNNENEHLKHELHTLTGLYAFDKLGKGVKASEDSVTVPRKDLIKLDYGDVE